MYRYGKVSVVGVTEDHLSLTTATAKISHMLGTAEEVLESCQAMEKEEQIKTIHRIPHPSVTEHCYINMMFNDVSMFVEQYIIEHRLAAYSIKSRRYVNFGDAGWNMPDFSYLGDENKIAMAEKALENLFKTSFMCYKDMIDSGIPKEDARYVLPYGFKSNFFASMDADNFAELIVDMVAGEGSKYPEIKFYGESLKTFYEENINYIDINKKIENFNGERNLDIYKTIFDRYEQGPEERTLTTIMSHTKWPQNIFVREALRSEGYDVHPWTTDTYVCTPEEFELLVKDVIGKKRQRALEQINFRVRINKISLATYTHVTRHRMQGLNPPNLLNAVYYDRYITPPSIKESEFIDDFNDIFIFAAETWMALEALGIKKEDRIYTLICGNTISVTTSINAEELLHMCKLRCCNRAQWEVRNIFNSILRSARIISDPLFKYFGPSCFVTGKCPEGKMSCGKMEEMKEFYGLEEKEFNKRILEMVSETK